MTTSSISRLHFVFAGCIALAGCSKDNTQNPEPAASQGQEATPSEPVSTTAVKPAEVSSRPSDAQILAILDTVDTGEIQQAEVANTKATDPRIRQFAQHMIQQHTQSKQQGSQLAAQASLTPTQSDMSGQLETKAKQMLSSLQSANSASFDKTYIEGQVKQHQEVLNVIDEQLMPAAQHSAVTAQLKAAKDMVKMHLEHAQELASAQSK
jgi:putative membrane protein